MLDSYAWEEAQGCRSMITSMAILIQWGSGVPAHFKIIIGAKPNQRDYLSHSGWICKINPSFPYHRGSFFWLFFV